MTRVTRHDESMTTRLNPYLHFATTAREALEFYAQALGGTLEMSTFGESGLADDPTYADRIMHGMLTTDDGLVIMASDAPPGMPHSEDGSRISVCLNTDDGDLSARFAALAVGGTVQVPFEMSPWGDRFGIIDDVHGITWLFNQASAPA